MARDVGLQHAKKPWVIYFVTICNNDLTRKDRKP
jgi:hypothetical protein